MLAKHTHEYESFWNVLYQQNQQNVNSVYPFNNFPRAVHTTEMHSLK